MSLPEFLKVYETPRVSKIPSVPIAIITLLVKLAVVGYLIWAIAFEKSYEEKSPLESKVSSVVSGVLHTRANDDIYPDLREGIWDAADLVKERSDSPQGFIILTNMAITLNQTDSICPENGLTPDCSSDEDCLTENNSGIRTGRCVNISSTRSRCEVSSWCPMENDTYLNKVLSRPAPFRGIKEFTVFVKNSVSFPAFGGGYETQNIQQSATADYLRKCLYNSQEDKFCPRFRIGDIVENATGGFDFDKVAKTGGEFAINVKWCCSFGLFGSPVEECNPEFSFKRLDAESDYADAGYKFMTTEMNANKSRNLVRNIGLRITIDVQGEGRKFDWIRCFFAIGAGMGLFAISSTIGELIFDAFVKMKDCCNWSCLDNYSESMKYNLRFIRGNANPADIPMK